MALKMGNWNDPPSLVHLLHPNLQGGELKNAKPRDHGVFRFHWKVAQGKGFLVFLGGEDVFLQIP